MLKLQAVEVATSFHLILSIVSKFDNTSLWKPLSKGISDKRLKFFGPPTTKWRPCKFFAKLNGNHLLMANISNFTNIRHLVYWKCIIWAKSDLPIINSVCEKFNLRLTGCRKCCFISLPFFIFPSFNWLLPKLLWKNHPFL